MPADALEVQYSYQMQDFEDISEALYKKDPKWRQWRRMRIGYFVLGITLLVLPFIGTGSLHDPDKFLFGFSVMGVLLIISALQTQPRRRARKQYATAIQSYGYKAIISKAGITTMSPTVRTDMQWAAFSSFLVTDHVLALFYEAVMYLFPRRAFSDEQWQDFLSLVQQNVGTRGADTGPVLS